MQIKAAPFIAQNRLDLSRAASRKVVQSEWVCHAMLLLKGGAYQ